MLIKAILYLSYEEAFMSKQKKGGKDEKFDLDKKSRLDLVQMQQ